MVTFLYFIACDKNKHPPQLLTTVAWQKFWTGPLWLCVTRLSVDLIHQDFSANLHYAVRSDILSLSSDPLFIFVSRTCRTRFDKHLKNWSLKLVPEFCGTLYPKCPTYCFVQAMATKDVQQELSSWETFPLSQFINVFDFDYRVISPRVNEAQKPPSCDADSSALLIISYERRCCSCFFWCKCARMIPLTVIYSFTLGKPSQKQWLTQDVWGAEVGTKRAPVHRKSWCIYSTVNWIGSLEGTFAGSGEANVIKKYDQRQTLQKPFGARCCSDNSGAPK